MKGKTEEKTEWQARSGGSRREMADLLVLPKPAESMQIGAGFRGKT